MKITYFPTAIVIHLWPRYNLEKYIFIFNHFYRLSTFTFAIDFEVNSSVAREYAMSIFKFLNLVMICFMVQHMFSFS